MKIRRTIKKKGLKYVEATEEVINNEQSFRNHLLKVSEPLCNYYLFFDDLLVYCDRYTPTADFSETVINNIISINEKWPISLAMQYEPTVEQLPHLMCYYAGVDLTKYKRISPNFLNHLLTSPYVVINYLCQKPTNLVIDETCLRTTQELSNTRHRTDYEIVYALLEQRMYNRCSDQSAKVLIDNELLDQISIKFTDKHLSLYLQTMIIRLNDLSAILKVVTPTQEHICLAYETGIKDVVNLFGTPVYNQQLLTSAIKGANQELIEQVLLHVSPDQTQLINACATQNINIVNLILKYKYALTPECFELMFLQDDQPCEIDLKRESVADDIELFINNGYTPNLEDVTRLIRRKLYVKEIERFNFQFDKEFFDACDLIKYWPYNLPMTIMQQVHICQTGTMKQIKELFAKIPPSAIHLNTVTEPRRKQLMKIITEKSELSPNILILTNKIPTRRKILRQKKLLIVKEDLKERVKGKY